MVAATLPVSFDAARNPDFWMAPFVKAAQRVIPTMLDSRCEAGPADCVSSGHAMHDLTSVIGMTGIVSGALAFSLSREAAIDVLRRMTGVETTEVDELVRDCVGEMANMIAGGGKLDLQPFPLKLGLPQVIQGHDYAVYAPRWSIHEWVPLETDFGPCSLTLGFDLAGLQSHLMGRSQ
jgi:chemotaxis protein CheX